MSRQPRPQLDEVIAAYVQELPDWPDTAEAVQLLLSQPVGDPYTAEERAARIRRVLLAGGDVGEPPGLEWTPSPACTGVTHRRAAVALSAIVTFVGVVVVLGKWVAPLIVALWTAESGG